jgi:Methyltransferase domain
VPGKLRELRWRLVDSAGSSGSRARERRTQLMLDRFPGFEAMSVIDLGGTPTFWERVTTRPAHVVVVNLEEQPDDVPDWITVERGDACTLAPRSSGEFDLVFSNSVIEHVGGHERRLRFADTVRSLADRYWIQTPYRYFPIEPHFLAPGMQFLPIALRAEVELRWPLVHTPAKDRLDAIDTVMGIELLDRTQLRRYFPDADVVTERIAAVPKSIIAVRT